MARSAKVGAYVLETLTTGMYTESLDSVREFVQNSADSIRQAERTKVLKQGEGRIVINIDPETRALRIRDNGIGIPSEEVYERLINIGMSDKSITSDAGFRGIGRLAGIAYCDRLRFRTSAKGEPRVAEVEFDCTGIRRAIAPSNRRTQELPAVMDKYTSQSQASGKPPDHFFEVLLEGITDAGEMFLNWQALEEYLSQVAPVDFDDSFIFAPKIKKWARENKVDMPTVAVVLEGAVNRQVHKPYKGYYRTSQQRQGQYSIEIKDVICVPESLEGGTHWLWYADTDLLGTIGDERAAGFRFRKHNIALGGPDRVADLFAQLATTHRRFNAYYIGEIHILSEDVIPNARRDGFEQNDAWIGIQKGLQPFLKQRCADAHAASSARNTPLQKVKRSAETIAAKAEDRLSSGLVSIAERDSLIEAIQKERDKIASWAERRTDDDEAKEVKPLVRTLVKLEDTLRNENHFAVRKARPNLDRKQRKVLQEVLAILHEVLSTRKCAHNEACHEAIRRAIFAKYQVPEEGKER